MAVVREITTSVATPRKSLRVEALGNCVVAGLRLVTMTSLPDLPFEVIRLIMDLVSAPPQLGDEAEIQLNHVAAWCRVAYVCKR